MAETTHSDHQQTEHAGEIDGRLSVEEAQNEANVLKARIDIVDAGWRGEMKSADNPTAKDYEAAQRVVDTFPSAREEAQMVADAKFGASEHTNRQSSRLARWLFRK